MGDRFRRRIDRLTRKFHQLAELAGTREPQRRIIFMHIPKCAGSSVVWAAKSYLGTQKSGKVVLLDDFGPPHERLTNIARAKDALFVSGHFGFETLQQIRKDAYVFTILREPYERLRSTHSYFGVLKKRNPLPDHLRDLPAETFFASREDAVLQWTDNMIARALAQTCDRTRSRFVHGEAMAAAAIRNLDAFDHVGFVDTIDHDMRKIADVARIPGFAKLGRRNTTESHTTYKTSAAPAPLSDKARLAVLHLVRHDLRVYEAALRKAGRSQGLAEAPAAWAV